MALEELINFVLYFLKISGFTIDFEKSILYYIDLIYFVYPQYFMNM